MTDTATDQIAARLNTIVHQLAIGGVHLQAGRMVAARECFKQASIALSTLRVQLDQSIGPERLRTIKSRKR